MNRVFELPELFTLSGLRVREGLPKDDLTTGPCADGAGKSCTACSSGASADLAPYDDDARG